MKKTFINLIVSLIVVSFSSVVCINKKLNLESVRVNHIENNYSQNTDELQEFEKIKPNFDSRKNAQASFWDLFWSCTGDKSYEHTENFVFTPRGTQVPTMTFTYPLDEDVINNHRDNQKESYEHVVVLDEPNNRYNCHSYAWHSRDISSNQYWMNDPSPYYSDFSYDEIDVTKEKIEEGDIICYFGYDEGVYMNLHSGIIKYGIREN